jgi:hypothetical protein
MKQCGAGGFRGGRFNLAASKAALEKYASCMRENGVDLPNPDTSGNGPVFNTKGIDANTPAFKAATGKCRSDLPETFAGRAANGTPSGAPGGAPAPGRAGGGGSQVPEPPNGG